MNNPLKDCGKPLFFRVENDEFARTALDMSEQTCFLHAFCKAELMTKVRVTTLQDAEAV